MKTMYCLHFNQIKQLNPKMLGYRHKNGTIKFCSAQTAENYAKNVILNGIKHDKENLVVYRNCEIFRICSGGTKSVSVNISELPEGEGVVVAHGHPPSQYNVSNPFSIPDIKSALRLYDSLGYKKSIVYNQYGENCTLSIIEEKQKGQTFLDKLPSVIKEKLKKVKRNKKFFIMDETEMKYLLSNKEQIYAKKVKQLYLQDNSIFPKELNSIKINNPKDEKKFLDWLYTKVWSHLLHDIIKEFAPKIGIEYSTTYSELLKFQNV